jgi:hypothetical protein
MGNQQVRSRKQEGAMEEIITKTTEKLEKAREQGIASTKI